MTNRDLKVEASQRCYKGCGCITMDKYNIRLFLLQHFLDSIKNTCCDVKEGLTILHDIQIIIWNNTESLKYLIKHLTVLRCNATTIFWIPLSSSVHLPVGTS